MVRNSGVARILDVQRWESQRYPSPVIADPIYRNIPLVGEKDEEADAQADVYRHIVGNNQASIIAAFVALTEHRRDPWCIPMMGATTPASWSRLALAVAVAVAVAGASDEAIVTEYLLTNGSSQETMLMTLAHINNQYCGVTALLSGGGAIRHRFQAVQARLNNLATRRVADGWR